MKAISISAVALIFTGSLLFFSFSNPPYAANQADQMVADWERAKAYTKEYLDAMPEDGVNFKATPEVRSFAEQMLHLAMGNVNITATSTGGEKIFKENIEKVESYKNKEALTGVVMQSYDYVIGEIKKLNDEQLNEKVKFFNGQEYSRAVGIGKAFEHQTHHRGQTTIYIRLKGIAPPNEKLF